jgi:hypothetical protein
MFKNLIYDLMMGIICLVMVCTIIGILFVPIVLSVWAEGRIKG